jgi:hypothetical protein
VGIRNLTSTDQTLCKEMDTLELALLGGKKSKSKPFPLWPQFDETERPGLNEVLESRV